MITHNNHAELKNNLLSKHEKVEMLMTSIKNRIQVSPAYLAKFVNILRIKRVYYSKAIQVLQVALRDKSPPASKLLQLTKHINRLEGHVKELEECQWG